ncbi:MAG: hypothetical protein P4L70_06900 [Parasulfuritortus sp.]|jgi:hypothetical protein|nr:hypothetical protein [Parasulfuritortus sp.]
MGSYRHHVSGFFGQREEAESALAKLVERGLPREQLQIFATEPPSAVSAQQAKSDGVLKDVLVDGAIGTAVGTGLGALAEVALAATSVSLFIASPLIAPLMMLGWGASIGGLIGAATGASDSAKKKDGWLSDLVADAISSGQFVLVAETRTEQESFAAREVIKDLVGDFRDANVA